MVSTRSYRSKFSVGEKVLCYEPDPTKARVLYDSKVLKVLVKTDKVGRKSVEYLIHFQGWNSSWDRYVSEDYVLKHTDENWRLQRKLAEKAHLRPGAYLYRRDRRDQQLKKDPQKMDSCTEEKDSEQGSSASAAGDHSIENDSNGDEKKRLTAEKHESDKKIVMEDTDTHHAHTQECDTLTELSDERNNNRDNGFMYSVNGDGAENGTSNEQQYKDSGTLDSVVDGGESVENGRSNDQQYKDFATRCNIDDGEVDDGEVDNVQDNKHEVIDDFNQSEDSAFENLDESNFTSEITDVMKELLELDNELIKIDKKVVHLPARPNVVKILESYVREYAVNQICGAPEKSQRKNIQHRKHQIGPLDMDRLNRSVNLCKEVADGVRIYFDFMLSGLLLYNEEREQYEQSRHMTLTKEPNSRVDNKSLNAKEENGKFQQPECSLPAEQRTCQDDTVKLDGRMGTSNTKMYSRSEQVVNSEGKGCTLTNTSAGGNSKETESLNPTETKSADKEQCLPSVNCKEKALSSFHDGLSSNTSISSKHLSRSLSNVASAEGVYPSDCHSSLEFLLPNLLEWQLVPESLYTEKPVMPSLVYGAIHLARLLVILPSHLLKTDIPAKKLKIVLQHLQMILGYLEQNKDWFAESFYRDNCSLLKQND